MHINLELAVLEVEPVGPGNHVGFVAEGERSDAGLPERIFDFLGVGHRTVLPAKGVRMNAVLRGEDRGSNHGCRQTGKDGTTRNLGHLSLLCGC